MLVTYGIVLAYLAAGGTFDDPAWLKLAFVGMLAPAAVAIAVQRAWGEPVRDGLALRLGDARWWLVAWGVAPIIGYGGLLASLALPWVRWDPALPALVERALATREQVDGLLALSASTGVHPLIVLLLPVLFLAPTVGLVNGSGEEIGWRGFLFSETRALGFWPQCAVVAAFWFCWHWPLVFMGYGQYADPWTGSAALALHIACVTPLFNYIRLRSGSSLAAGMLHSALGGATLLAVSGASGGTPVSTGYGSLPSNVVIVLVTAVIVLAGRRGETAGSTELTPER